jgi:hypothetical protein
MIAEKTGKYRRIFSINDLIFLLAQKTLPVTRKFCRNEFLPGKELAKCSSFSTGGLLVGGITSPIRGTKIDKANQERQMTHQGTRALWSRSPNYTLRGHPGRSSHANEGTLYRKFGCVIQPSA